MRIAMIRPLCAAAALLGALSSAPAGDVPQVYGAPPRLLIASALDADGNLVLFATEQCHEKLTRDVQKDGKKATQEVTVTYPVTVLNRQSVLLKGVTIYDRAGKKVSLSTIHGRDRLPLVTVPGVAGTAATLK
jgi:hypothetical protein